MLNKMVISFLLKNKGKIASIILTFVGGCVFLILLIPTVLFSGGQGSDFIEKDGYEKAWEANACSKETKVILQDIRAMEAYVDPDSFENISKEEALKRMNTIYLTATYDEKDQKICLIKTQEEIIENLKKEYTFTEEQIEELVEQLMMVRNGRQYFINPVKDSILVRGFDQHITGWILQGKKNDEVISVADGKIVNIQNSTYEIPYKEGYRKGLTVTVKYEIQNGLDEDGEYIMKTVFGVYSMMQGVTLNIGQEIKQGTVIGKTAQNLLLFEIINDKSEKVNPLYYMSVEMSAGKLRLPFDAPYTITSEMGERSLDNFHYGIDLVKEKDAPIKVLADGEIISVNSSCAPYGGKLGNWCPLFKLRGAGNYIQIKFRHENETYYATYMHMAETKVHAGDIVHAGDVIGTQGNSGNSSGTHLHLEIHKGMNKIATKEGLIDPIKLLEIEEK